MSSPIERKGNDMPCARKNEPGTEAELLLLREINRYPDLTQRELAHKIGVSLGKANFLLQALMEKGFIKAENFRKSNNKLAYLYYLTPQGLEEKARLTVLFLQRKIAEYEELKKDIELLKKEAHLRE
jgi:EPS-associated MarR family transcriptional regulator